MKLNADTIFGLFMVYTWVHWTVIQFTKNWEQRNNYEKIITVVAIVTLVLLFVGLALES